MTPAAKLVEALERMKAISDRQSESLQRSRERAERVRKEFYDRVSGHSGSGSSVWDADASVEHMQDMYTNQRGRETAFLDAFRALMLLYKDSEHRSGADEVYSCLYQIRMIDIGDPETDFKAPQPTIPSIDPDQTLEEKRKSVVDAFMGFDEQLYSSMESSKANQDEQIAKSEALLDKALAAAKQLL